MKKPSGVKLILLLTAVLAGIFLFHVCSTTRHLTETPPCKVQLHSGINDLTFPVVRGRYLLRVGTPNMEPATFRFAVQGTITAPSGRQPLNAVYEPTAEILNKEINGGYMSRFIEITEKKGIVKVRLEVSHPEDQELVCLFHGIK